MSSTLNVSLPEDAITGHADRRPPWNQCNLGEVALGLEKAFTGHFTDHHAFLLGKMLARIDGIDADIAQLDARIEKLIAPFAAAAERLDEIPGIGRVAAAIIIARSAWT